MNTQDKSNPHTTTFTPMIRNFNSEWTTPKFNAEMNPQFSQNNSNYHLVNIVDVAWVSRPCHAAGIPAARTRDQRQVPIFARRQGEGRGTCFPTARPEAGKCLTEKSGRDTWEARCARRSRAWIIARPRRCARKQKLEPTPQAYDSIFWGGVYGSRSAGFVVPLVVGMLPFSRGFGDERVDRT